MKMLLPFDPQTTLLSQVFLHACHSAGWFLIYKNVMGWSLETAVYRVSKHIDTK